MGCEVSKDMNSVVPSGQGHAVKKSSQILPMVEQTISSQKVVSPVLIENEDAATNTYITKRDVTVRLTDAPSLIASILESQAPVILEDEGREKKQNATTENNNNNTSVDRDKLIDIIDRERQPERRSLSDQNNDTIIDEVQPYNTSITQTPTSNMSNKDSKIVEVTNPNIKLVEESRDIVKKVEVVAKETVDRKQTEKTESNALSPVKSTKHESDDEEVEDWSLDEDGDKATESFDNNEKKIAKTEEKTKDDKAKKSDENEDTELVEDSDDVFEEVDTDDDGVKAGDDSDSDSEADPDAVNDFLADGDLNQDDIEDIGKAIDIINVEEDAAKVLNMIEEKKMNKEVKKTPKPVTPKLRSHAIAQKIENFVESSAKLANDEKSKESGDSELEKLDENPKEIDEFGVEKKPKINAKSKFRAIQLGVFAVDKNKQVFVTDRRDSVTTTSKAVLETNEKGQKLVNGYVIEKLLGSGAYGKVKLCRKGDQLYAIKMMKRNILKNHKLSKQNNADEMDLFRREVAIMKKLKHPNIVELHEVIDDPDCSKFYLVLEYVEKGQVFQDKKPIPEPIARNYLRDVCQGLEYLHFQNVIHRDLKPENLLISSTGVVKIADFGVSGVLDKADDKMTETQGTPAFQAPEVCAGTEYQGSLIDVWALGVTMYVMLFGIIPFGGATITEMYKNIQESPVVFKKKPEISSEAIDLISAMLNKDPTKRISLKDVMRHPWMTDNGEMPLPITEYVLIKVTDDDVKQAISAVDNLLLVIKVKSTVSRLLKGARKQLEDQRGTKLSRWVKTIKKQQEEQKQLGELKAVAAMALAEDNNDDSTSSQKINTDPTPKIRKDMMGRKVTRRKRSLVNDSFGPDEDEEETEIVAPKAPPSPILEIQENTIVAERINTRRASLALAQELSDGTDLLSELGASLVKLDDKIDSNETKKLISKASASPRTMKRTNDFIMVTKGFKQEDVSMKKEKILVTSSASNELKPYVRVDTEESESLESETAELIEEEEEEESGDLEACDDFAIFDDLITNGAKGKSADEQIYQPGSSYNPRKCESWCMNKNINIASGEAHLQGKRPTMEDASAMFSCLASAYKLGISASSVELPFSDNEAAFFAIYDGHNGTGAADYCAERLHMKIAENFVRGPEIETVLIKMFKQTDDEILKIQEENKLFSGNTAVTLLLRKLADGTVEAFCSNLGDSRCILSSAGTVIPMSFDQKPTNPDEKARIQAAGGWVSNKRVNGVLGVSRAFGDIEYKTLKEKCWEKTFKDDLVSCKPEIIRRIIQPQDEFFVLACDGVWDVMSSQAVVNKVRQSLEKNPDLNIAAKHLVKEALDRNSIDNVSALIVAVNQNILANPKKLRII